MIFNPIIIAFHTVIDALLGTSSFSFDLVFGQLDAFLPFLSYAAYFLPVNTIAAIMAVLIAEELFKISLSFCRMVFHFLPFT